MISADKAAASWVRGIENNVDKAVESVNSLTIAPGQQAADKADDWQRAVSSSAAKDKFKRRVSAVSLSDYKQAYVTKGRDRMLSGARAAQGKMQKHLAKWLPYIESVAQQVRTLPSGTLDNNIARMVAQVKGNAAFQG